ncbi:hypothetical protein Acr_26g0002560 [Actinidia rufa]|uniref:Uncharacterized protein n=1 Tax=Actinidia rufa TaxID=165716 RepID=A0A7J0H1N7_9ERIC|nr:hypothetical protein Acr_26g0002560 [Actinidia rufa]
MGDSETVVDHTSAVVGCTYAGYSSTNYSIICSIIASDAGAFADATTTRDLATSAAVADVANAVADGSEPSYGVVDDVENITALLTFLRVHLKLLVLIFL